MGLERKLRVGGRCVLMGEGAMGAVYEDIGDAGDAEISKSDVAKDCGLNRPA